MHVASIQIINKGFINYSFATRIQLNQLIKMTGTRIKTGKTNNNNAGDGGSTKMSSNHEQNLMLEERLSAIEAMLRGKDNHRRELERSWQSRRSTALNREGETA